METARNVLAIGLSLLLFHIPTLSAADCNNNGVEDTVDIDSGTSRDCNGNTAPDECDLVAGTSRDGNGDGILDECQALCGQVLTEDLTLENDLICEDTALIIGASNVTIDGQGHTITGRFVLGVKTAYGILTAETGWTNVTIKNCRITDFTTAIRLASVNSTVSGNELFGNIVGLFLSGQRNSVIDNVFDDNSKAMSLGASSSGNDILNNTVTNDRSDVNFEDGIEVLGQDNTVADNTISGLSSVAIDVKGMGNRLIHNTITESLTGIGVSADNQIVQDNTLIGERASDIGVLIVSSTNVDLSGNFFQSLGDGLRITSGANENLITDNTFLANRRHVLQDSSDGNLFTGNTFRAATRVGMELNDSNDNVITNNIFDNPWVGDQEVINATDDGVNLWNVEKAEGHNILDGSFVGGNFWHDYHGEDHDGDGLGDTDVPYDSGGNIASNGDFLPLVSVPFIRGDVNCNGCVTLIDAIDLGLELALPDPFANSPYCNCEAVRDANGDGTVDMNDPAFLIDFVLHEGPPPPAPFPSCGPGTSKLTCGEYPVELCQSPRFKRGDANCDGCVDEQDAMLITEHLSDDVPFPCDCLAAADANGNGTVDTGDALVIFELCSGGPKPPVECTVSEDPGSCVDYPSSSCCSGCPYQPGDCNRTGVLDISDSICLLGFLFLGGPAALPCADPGANVVLMDCNGDMRVDVSDAICFLKYLFIGGTTPVWGTEPIWIESCPVVSQCGL